MREIFLSRLQYNNFVIVISLKRTKYQGFFLNETNTFYFKSVGKQ